MRKKLLVVTYLCVLAFSLGAQKSLPMAKLSLLSTNRSNVSLSELAQSRPLVLIFMEAECPITQKYVPILRGLQDSFPNVAFAAVFTRWNEVDDVRRFGDAYDLKMPAFIDKQHKLIKKIGAKITPEAFLIAPNGAVLYRGAIDNWYFGLGKHRQEPNAYFLKDALSAFLSNKEIKIKKTDAVGCIIEL